MELIGVHKIRENVSVLNRCCTQAKPPWERQTASERLWYRCNRSLKRLPRSPPLLNAIISWEELPRSLRWLQQQTKAKGAQESVAHYNLIRFIHRVIKSRLELPPGRSHQHRPKRFLERARARGSPLPVYRTAASRERRDECLFDAVSELISVRVSALGCILLPLLFGCRTTRETSTGNENSLFFFFLVLAISGPFCLPIYYGNQIACQL